MWRLYLSKKVDYTDKHGIKRRVILPDDDSIPPDEGIMVSVDLERIFDHMSPESLKQLYNECWIRGLIEPSDFQKPGAGELYVQVMRAVYRHDWLTVKNLAEVYKNGP